MSLTGPSRELGMVFDQVADAYDAARPGYPDELFRALSDLSGIELRGATVIDVGAGTGISTRALQARGARVVSIDPGAQMLARLVSRTAGATPVLADGNALPVADGVADLVTYAQSWHWLDPVASIEEARRALRQTGAVAAWWNSHDMAKADWLAAFDQRLAEECQGYWGPAHPEWRVSRIGEALNVEEVWVPWTRLVGIEDFLLDLRSHSYIAAMSPEAADALVGLQRRELAKVFPDGLLNVPMRVYLAVGR